MTWFEIVVDIIAGVLFVAANIMYIIHALHNHGGVEDSIERYNAFDDILYLSTMNKFGKVISCILVSILCCASIALLYIVKFIYWITHFKKD